MAADANVSSYEANIEQDKVNAAAPDLPMYKATLDRNLAMQKEGVVSRQVLDDANKDYLAALNKRDSARAQIGVDTARLAALCELVAHHSRRAIHRAKPITGADAFRHESGIHTAALLKTPTAYQPFPCEETGRIPEPFAIGKHSGSAGLQSLLDAGGISVPAWLCPEIVAAVRRRARTQKGAVSRQELAAIARQLSSERGFHRHGDIRT